MSTYWQAEARFDWTGYVEAQGAECATSGRCDEYVLQCSECQKEKLAVNVKRRAWRCFTCGDGGRGATSLVSRVEGKFWHEAMAVVLTGHQKAIGRIDQITSLVGRKSLDRPPSWIPQPRRFPSRFEPLCLDSAAASAGRVYCEKRGISPMVASAMQLGVCESGRFRNRLIFPVVDQGGRLIFWQGRAMWDPSPGDNRYVKTLSPKLYDSQVAGASDVLLNLSYVGSHVRTDRVIVVEGPVDCAHAWPDSVATFGKQISGRQIELLMRAGVKELDLCYDSDAMSSMMKAAPELADLFTVRLVHLPTGTDPGVFSKAQIDYYRRSAIVWGTGERLIMIPHTLR